MSMTWNRILGVMMVVAFGASAGCGGGSQRGSSAPSPPVPDPDPTPPPVTDVAPVTIFASPQAREFVSMGASTTDAGDGYTPVEQDARLLNILFDGQSQPLIRYDAGGYYEIKLPGMAYDRLVHYKGLLDPTADNNFFQPASVAQNLATFIIMQTRLQGYEACELGAWTKSANRVGYVAFGVPAAPTDIPASGSATYEGPAIGMVDITYEDNFYGGYYFNGASGSVTLTVDYPNDRVTGSVKFDIGDTDPARGIGTFPIVAATGLTGFSSSFQSQQAGFNRFEGLLAGPAAQEAMGNFALSVIIDGRPHQLFGAWIAKKVPER